MWYLRAEVDERRRRPRSDYASDRARLHGLLRLLAKQSAAGDKIGSEETKATSLHVCPLFSSHPSVHCMMCNRAPVIFQMATCAIEDTWDRLARRCASCGQYEQVFKQYDKCGGCLAFTYCSQGALLRDSRVPRANHACFRCAIVLLIEDELHVLFDSLPKEALEGWAQAAVQGLEGLQAASLSRLCACRAVRSCG
jgi:hypothetical protein